MSVSKGRYPFDSLAELNGAFNPTLRGTVKAGVAMPQYKKVFLAGIGEVGRYVLEFLARDAERFEIYAADLDKERTERIANNVRIGTLHHHKIAEIHPLEVDLLNVGQTAEQLAQIKPDIVINGAVLQTWHVIRQLPDEQYAQLSSATLGAWLPVQLTLAYRLAQAIRDSGLKVPFVNTSLSCLTNAALGKVGLAPTVGVGNVDLIQPAVRVYIAKMFNAPVSEVDVQMVAHHVHWVTPREEGYEKGAPFFMRVKVRDSDVTGELGDLEEVMHQSVLLYHPDTSFSAVSASSTIKNTKALLSEDEILTHSPAPEGLPGGYPLKISKRGVELNLPEGLGRGDAIDINLRASRFDGIQEFCEDGTVIFTDKTYEIMKRVLGFDCKKFHVRECEQLAMEQMSCYRQYSQQFI